MRLIPTSTLVLVFSASILPVSAQPSFRLLTEFEAFEPLAIAADTHGGLYYTKFTFNGANASKVYYVADPVNQNGIDKHVAIVDDDPSPLGRGWHGIAVDDVGAVYVTVEAGSNDLNEVRKLTPGPDFAPDPDFAGGVIFGGLRFNGICWMGRDDQGTGHIALTTFDGIQVWNAENGDFVREAGGGETYQRDCAYNPETGDVYISTNRNRAGDGLPQRSVNVWSGGSVENLDGYSDSITSGLIEEGASSTEFGVNGQQIGFDLFSGLIIVSDQDGNSPNNDTLGFYDPENPSSAVLRLGSDDADFVSPSDAVTVQSGGDVLLYVSDPLASKIFVFTNAATGVQNFELY